jgi:hypothetical protein
MRSTGSLLMRRSKAAGRRMGTFVCA